MCRAVAVGFLARGARVMVAARTTGERNETVRPARVAGDECRYVTGQGFRIDGLEGGRCAHDV
jgi:LmbE family N-acetylglucosaminyl deacetylase